MNLNSFPDAEVAEYAVENILDVDTARQLAEALGGGPQFLRHDIFRARIVQHPAERFQGRPECLLVALAVMSPGSGPKYEAA